MFYLFYQGLQVSIFPPFNKNQNNIMNNHQILLNILFLATCISASSLTKVDKIYIANSKCSFSFLQLQSEFTFKNCSTPNQTTSNWAACLQLCCPRMPQRNFKPSYHALNICERYNSSSDETQISTTIFLVVGCCLLALLSLFLIEFFQKKCKLVVRRHVEEKIKEEKILTVEWKDEKDVNFQMEKEVKWSQNSQKKHGRLSLTEQTCTICLENGASAQLICKHWFHPQCIGRWFERQNWCPCCRHSNIRGIKIYCKECCSNYYVAVRNMVAENGPFLQLLCKECKEKDVKETLSSQMPQISCEIICQHKGSNTRYEEGGKIENQRQF